MSGQIGVIYCGSCGAMNPRTNHYCSACAHQLVDAYHASEGLRVYITPDPGAPLVEIVDTGTDLTVVDTSEDLPSDFVKVTLPDGRVGYVRLREVEGAVGTGDPSSRREQVGCISSTAMLAIMALAILTGALVLITALQSDDANAGFISVLVCLTVVPFLLLVVGFYLYVRKREEELLDERLGETVQDESDHPAPSDRRVESPGD